MKILEFSMLSYFSGRFEIEPSKYFKANKFGKYFKYWRVYQPAPGVRTFQLFASPLQSWKSDKTHHHSISRLFIMYPQRTPPESGMEKSGRRNLISSQCLACYVNLPTSPRLSCTRADFSVFLKVTKLVKKSTFNHTFDVLHTLTYLIKLEVWIPPLHDRPGRFGQKNTSSSPHHHQPPPLCPASEHWTKCKMRYTIFCSFFPSWEV